MKLRHYTLRYLVIAILLVIALWAGLFYAFITEEVYDNIDDGLKNMKLHIVQEAHFNPKILNTNEYGLNQFKITLLPKGDYNLINKFETTTMFMDYDDDYEPIRKLTCIFNANDGNSYQLEIVTSMIEEDELLENMLVALLVLYIMIVASIIIINQYILKKAWKSFYELLDKLHNYSITSNKSFVAPHSEVDEFTKLGNEMQKMISRTEKSYKSQKEFIENASHELQTPLAIVRNKLELLAENCTSQQQLSDIEHINDAVNRMIRLNKTLLTLSRVENQQYDTTTLVNLGEITDALLEDFADLIEYKDIKLIKDYTHGLLVHYNVDLASMIIGNLLKNAIVHNKPKGIICITSTDNKLTIKNTGIETPLDGSRIFDRFYSHTSSDKQSTGLGLAMIKSITDTYNNITIAYRYDDGHCFDIIFNNS